MTANNTYGQKLYEGAGRMAVAVGACVVFVFLFALGWVAWGAKKVSEGAEYATEQGKEWSAKKATANASQAGSDFKEAYNLYQSQSADEQNPSTEAAEMQPVNKVEDEGYCSEGEKITA